MAWWRRDPSLLSRSSVHRYAQRILRDHEAALRTRCFSCTPAGSAQLKNDDRGKRPAGVSDIEWDYMQRYNRWTKRLVDDPYYALFGASNDMLKGKGLKDWEWIHKSFPKWMLRDMDLNEFPSRDMKEKHNKSATHTPDMKTASANSEYPKKVEIENNNDQHTARRDSRISETSLRAGNFERDISSGIISPSDLRRPRESPYVKVVKSTPMDQSQNSSIIDQKARVIGASPLDIELNPRISRDELPKANHDSSSNTLARDAGSTSEVRIGLDSSVDKEAFKDSLARRSDKESHLQEKAWRETTLQRRLAGENIENAPTNRSVSTVPEESELPIIPQSVPIPSSQSSDALLGDQFSEILAKKWEFQQQQEKPHVTTPPPVPPRISRSTSQILSQLPEEDIDFLSAADIRANMGMKRNNVLSDKERKVEREKLEQQFESASENVQELHNMVGAQVVNNQHIRRKVREMRESQHVPDSSEAVPKNDSVEPAPAVEAPQVESSIDRMKRWLETTGASFAKQFWQDPTESEDITKSRLFFDKAYHYIRKGRSAMAPIVEDLERDLPASQTLLKRLKKDEDTLEFAVQRLRQRSSSGMAQGLSPRKIRAMESIKVRFHQTNTELEKAYAALQEIASTTKAADVPESYKRRLSVASKVLHKNTQLSRMLIYSLQTRLEDPKIDRNILPNYKLVADDLLSLRDTQMTLTRFVDRAMLVYGVTPQTAIDAKFRSISDLEPAAADFENCEEPYIRARLAADALLINQINAHGSSKAESPKGEATFEQKINSKASFDEPKPLAHSLFRPFGPVFDQLGMKTETDTAAEKAKAEAEKKIRDDALVSEIKKAYEDKYGPITAEHRQVELKAPSEANENSTVTEFEMLKDDPLATTRPDTATDDSISSRAQVDVSSLANDEKVSQIESFDDAGLSKSSGILQPDISTPALTPLEPSSPKVVQQDAEESTSSAPATESASAMPDTALENPVGTEIEEQASPFHNLPTHYTVIIRDPETDNLTITTSTSGPPRDTSPALPLHQALSALDAPAKFIPYIEPGLEVVSARKDMLVLRDSLDSSVSFQVREVISNHKLEESAISDINPIDGTARLSPTGYHGPEESPEQIEKEFKERREAAGRFNRQQQSSDEQFASPPRKGRTGAGVIKTAIWATALCYVVGVFGEIATSPFKV